MADSSSLSWPTSKSPTRRRPGDRELDDAAACRELERSLARLSADEIVAALGLAHAPLPARAAIRAVFTAVSAPLGRALARFDRRIETVGLPGAAADFLCEQGTTWTRLGPRPPAAGPLLVVADHPGAYDALVLLAAIERDDVAIVAADRTFLRAMPALRRHLVFVPDGPSGISGRATGLRRALVHLARGGALLHFGAGRIEPDPAFPVESDRALTGARAERLAPWQPGTGALVRGAARAGGVVVGAVVSGVHSARAKRLLVTRLAERRGLTTLAPLLQVALRRCRDVEAVVRFADAVDAHALAEDGEDALAAARVREVALSLWPSSSRTGERLPERADRVGPRR